MPYNFSVKRSMKSSKLRRRGGASVQRIGDPAAPCSSGDRTRFLQRMYRGPRCLYDPIIWQRKNQHLPKSKVKSGKIPQTSKRNQQAATGAAC